MIADLGARVREPREEERARTFHVGVTGSSPAIVTLTITDLSFETTTRQSKVKDCASATKTAALFVSLAADEDRTTHVAQAPAPPVTLGPAELHPPDMVTTKAAPRAAIGLGTELVFGTHDSTARFGAGARGLAGGLVGHSTYVGVSGTFTADKAINYGDNSPGGMSAHLGGLVGWGAPFTDDWIGFVAEVGVGAGRRPVALPQNANFVGMPGEGTALTSLPATFAMPALENWIAPYASAEVVLQIPQSLRLGSRVLPVHPMIMGGLRAHTDLSRDMFMSAGLAWNGL